ncbi:MAG: UDP-N-acetylmuramate--L-alanine ligase [Pirellulales bacterium]
MNLALQASRYIPRGLVPSLPRSAHLIGIAGSGMRALADVLAAQGWQLSGSDLKPENPAWAAERGITVYVGHAAEQITSDAGLIVYSDAVGPENEERRRAKEIGLRQLGYPQMLGQLVRGRLGLAVAGTHGKSTTTAMAAEILVAAGLDPAVIAGAAPLGKTSGGRAGRGPPILVEACEYRRNFLHLFPRYAVVTGIEHDHFDYFASADDVEAAFAEFISRLPANGALVFNAECPRACREAGRARSRVVSFGIDCAADWRAINLVQHSGLFHFDICSPGGNICNIQLRVPGRHNVLNALAAAGLAAQLGVRQQFIQRGLERFAGLERRLERVGPWVGAVWYDDYAHHPTEIRAALAALRQMFPNRRIWCIFQPHQRSRTRALLDEFADSLQNADRIGIAEVFAAREYGGAACLELAAELAERTRERGSLVLRQHALGRLIDEVGQQIALDDVLLTLGAGDIRKVWHANPGRIRSYRAAG